MAVIKNYRCHYFRLNDFDIGKCKTRPFIFKKKYVILYFILNKKRYVSGRNSNTHERGVNREWLC
jgi:hypothetical protein